MNDNPTTISQSGSVVNFFDKKILIVDDVALICRVVQKQLISAGFQSVEIEDDPRLVMERVKSFEPELILLDIFMPHISGLELLKSVREITEYDNILILMLSSAGAEEQFQSLELGAFGFIQKPITPVKLVQTITNKFAMATRLGLI